MNRILVFLLFIFPVVLNAQRTYIGIEWPAVITSQHHLNSEIVLDTTTVGGKQFKIGSMRNDTETGIPYISVRRFITPSLFFEPSFHFTLFDYWMPPVDQDYDNYYSGSLKVHRFVPGLKFGWTPGAKDVRPFIEGGFELTFSKAKCEVNENGVNVQPYTDYFNAMRPMLLGKIKAGMQFDWLTIGASYGISLNAYDPGGHVGKYTEAVYVNVGMIVYRSGFSNRKRLELERDQFQVERSEKLSQSNAEVETGAMAPYFLLSMKDGGYHASYTTVDGYDRQINVDAKDVVVLPIPFWWMGNKIPFRKSRYLFTGFDFIMGYQVYRFKNAYSSIISGGQVSPTTTDPALDYNPKHLDYGCIYLAVNYPTLGVKTVVGSHSQVYLRAGLNHNFFIPVNQADHFRGFKPYLPAISAQTGFKRNRWGIVFSAERSFLPVHREKEFKGLSILKIGFSYEFLRI